MAKHEGQKLKYYTLSEDLKRMIQYQPPYRTQSACYFAE